MKEERIDYTDYCRIFGIIPNRKPEELRESKKEGGDIDDSEYLKAIGSNSSNLFYD